MHAPMTDFIEDNDSLSCIPPTPTEEKATMTEEVEEPLSPPFHFAMIHAPGKRECRICFESDNDRASSDLIAPCRCNGTSKWVHRTCLDKWRSTNPEDIAFSQCLECRTEYVMTTKTSSDHLRRCLFCMFVSRDVLLATVIVQLIIALFGLMFWGIALSVYDQSPDDPNQQQLLGPCKTTRCVIGLSYAGGVLVMLFCLGILGSYILCKHGCSYEESLTSVGYDRETRALNSQRRNCCRCGSCNCDADGCRGCNSSACDCGSCDGDCAIVLIVVLAIVGVVIAAIGFLVGAFVAVVGVQTVIQKHLWRLQKRRLVQEYPVQDLSAGKDEEEGNSHENPTTMEPVPTASSKLSVEDAIRLRRLGLLTWN
jgi:hypothetical protein